MTGGIVSGGACFPFTKLHTDRPDFAAPHLPSVTCRWQGMRSHGASRLPQGKAGGGTLSWVCCRILLTVLDCVHNQAYNSRICKKGWK